MIQRRILTGPIEPFDYFNDYKDTVGWLKCIKSIDAANKAEELRVGHEKWWAEFTARLDAKSSKKV